MHQDNSNGGGLQWFWGEKEIQIFNASTHIVYVIVDNPYSHCALDIGCCTVYPITQNTGPIVQNGRTYRREKFHSDEEEIRINDLTTIAEKQASL